MSICIFKINSLSYIFPSFLLIKIRSKLNMRKQKTTVLFISNDNYQTKALQIPTKIIKNFKLYLSIFIISLVAAITFGVTFFMNYYNVKSVNANLKEEMHEMKEDVALLDSMHIKDKISNIESRIFDINNFLRERGIYQDSAVGGNYYEERNIDLASFDFFDKYVTRIFDDIKNIPIGSPYEGAMTSNYGYRSNPFGGRRSEFHSGIDFKGNTGDPVYATADGVVGEAHYKGGYGNAVVINHAYGLTTLYGHLSAVNVEQGQSVNAGDVIGFLGSTGRSTGPHLHYEVRKNGVDLDPNQFLQF
jgi:murein DD-endopeptidase MepM/ murein hydrolase activator NlpD